MSIPKIPQHVLSNGVTIPLIGFGTFAKGRSAGLSYEAVTTALDAGYRHLDCAWFYNNEDEIGAAIKDWQSRNPDAARSDLFLTTKVWPHLCSSAEDIEWSLDDSLRKLGTHYVDCFLIHWPIAAERKDDMRPRQGADSKYIINKRLTEDPSLIWPALEKLHRAGKARSIGVSNWSIKKLDRLLACAEVKPVVNQIEIHPYFPNSELVEYCLSKAILPVAFSSLGSQHAIPTTQDRLLQDPKLVALAANRGVSLAQLLIAWGLRRGYGVLPKSTTADRIKNNLDLVELSDAEFQAISDAAAGKRFRFCDLEYIFGYDAWA
ncbi:MAG: hypothetical protein Q9165_008490 [Trypethelium subeluteriae]